MASVTNEDDTTETMAATVPLIDVDPQGDVLLLLKEKEIRVSSKVLSLVSKVFSAMFGPDRFAEGVALKEHGSCQVALSDDDTEAMLAMCQVLHHRPQEVACDIDSGFLKKIAILADKYECTNALSLWAQVQTTDLRSQLNRYEGKDITLLFVAYTLDLAEHFSEITRRIIFSEIKWDWWGYCNANDLLPDELMCKWAPRSYLTLHHLALLTFCKVPSNLMRAESSTRSSEGLSDSCKPVQTAAIAA